MTTAKQQEKADILEGLETMAQYGLPKPETAAIFDVGTGPYLAYFEKELLDEFVAQGGATCRFFEGSYGAGKTHLLQLLKGIAQRRGMVVASTDLSQSLKLEDWRQITMYILQTMEAQVGGEIVRSLPNILAALERQGSIDRDGLFRANLPHRGFQKAMIWAVQRDTLDDTAWMHVSSFLAGEKVNAVELRRSGLAGVKGPLTQRNAELVLKTVLGGLYHLGVPGAMLLFDENEKTLTLMRNTPTLKQRVAANLMRRLIDGCTTGMLVGTVAVFAVLPDFLETCANVYPALGQRLQIVRGGLQKRAWRVPVLPLTQINRIQDQHQFLEETVTMLIGHAYRLGARTEGLESALRLRGTEIIEHNVGTGYKRELMKALAGLVLSRVSAEEVGA